MKVGAGLHPRSVLRVLHALLDAAEPKIPRRRFHDLRHSAASRLTAAGVELVEVSQLLGHNELRVTADLDSHVQKQNRGEGGEGDGCSSRRIAARGNDDDRPLSRFFSGN